MGIFSNFMEGETGGIPNGIQGALSGNNPMLNIGLGILANNTGNYGSFGAAIGKGAQQGIQSSQEAKRMALQSAMYNLQMAKMKKDLEQQQKQQDFLKTWGNPNANKTETTQLPDSWQNAPQGTDAPNFNMDKVAGGTTTTETPYFDQNKALLGAVQSGAIDFKDYLTLTTKDNTPIKVGAGETLYNPKDMKPIFTAPEKVDYNKAFLPDGTPNKAYQDYEINKQNKPSAIQEYEYAKQQGYGGTFKDFQIEQKRAGASNVSVNTGQKGFDNTLKLRGDFRSEPIYKAHNEVQSAYSQINAALKQASPAGDLAAATKIMKILDPGSVVRESELGMAMAASGALDRLVNYADMRIKGTKLTPAQRVDFKALADSLYSESVKQYNNKRTEYKGITTRNDLNELDVLGEEAKLPNAASGAKTAEELIKSKGW